MIANRGRKSSIRSITNFKKEIKEIVNGLKNNKSNKRDFLIMELYTGNPINSRMKQFLERFRYRKLSCNWSGAVLLPIFNKKKRWNGNKIEE